MVDLVIDVRNLTRTFAVGDVQVRALRGVDLAIERGEFVAIMGSSGSGKSTLMAILGCLDPPTGGRYYLEGVDVAGLNEPQLAKLRGERLGFVFQSFNLLARTSAIENVALPLFYSERVSERRDRMEKARAALKLLGLAERENNTPAQLSGGQQQRVAIARALINGPSVLFADEPTGNLDTRTSHEIMETLASLNRDQGVTIIVVTHEQDIAEFAGRIITMRDGLIVSDVRREAPASSQLPASAEAKGSSAAAAIFHPTSAVSARLPRVSTFAFASMIVSAAVAAIARNKLRSALTMLGVFIGVAALIAMVAVGDGANAAVRKQIESLGTNLAVVLPGAVLTGGARVGFGSASTLTVADAQAIRREAATVSLVAYLMRQMGQVQLGAQNWTTNIQAVSVNYPPVTNWSIAAGRGVTPEDERRAALVVVIGQTVYKQLFTHGEDPLGAMILVKGFPLRVVGLLAAKGQSMWGQDQDDLVMIPFKTGEQKVLGVASPNQATNLTALYPLPPNPFNLQPRLAGYVNSIYVQAAAQDKIKTAIDEINQILMRRHRIKPTDVKDFDIRNLSQIAETAEGSSRIMAVLLAIVASISLVVGGIGIMNILLVSVTERTREIGLRMAVGARRLHVLAQFLAEAVLISVSGGVAGILAGITISEAIALFSRWSSPVSFAAIAIGFAFSAAVGIFFGYYPARKAARLDPIQALRYE
ncbi:ABC transporter permease [Methylocystis heyeri]|uniref:ATP-binding cassette domain-containing protein n=1 Tax=Methylocystis heyeri TaxID=391905 RepID=A0A6B8KDD7_9HYPH|nr:ABC transporter permease [Methylocystis heyeri]QGM44443.1 ATP-binding cassette domain-containing protein [Methylocystis heyeri]